MEHAWLTRNAWVFVAEGTCLNSRCFPNGQMRHNMATRLHSCENESRFFFLPFSQWFISFSVSFFLSFLVLVPNSILRLEAGQLANVCCPFKKFLQARTGIFLNAGHDRFIMYVWCQGNTPLCNALYIVRTWALWHVSRTSDTGLDDSYLLSLLLYQRHSRNCYVLGL
jgi:hypothetical protein